MECKIGHFRHILLFYFRKEGNAVHAVKKLRDVHGKEALKDRRVEIGLKNSVLGILSQR